MEVRYIQGIYIIPVALILQSRVNGHETPTKLFIFQGRGATNHHKGNGERRIRLTKQTEKKKNLASAEPSAPCLPDTVARA